MSLGIVLCKKCGMGISPISSIPYVLSFVIPISFGNLTMLFHAFNTVVQMLLTRNIRDVRMWMQIPLAFVFGRIIDLFDGIIAINDSILANQILALIFSVFFTALGMVWMLGADFIQNPPDGTVKEIGIMTGKEIGSVKIGYDICCVLCSLIVGAVFLHRIEGFGAATIVSAIFVGKTMGLIRAAGRYRILAGNP